MQPAFPSSRPSRVPSGRREHVAAAPPPVLAGPAPEVAGLASLLSFGLSREAVQASTTQVVGPSGEVRPDPVLAQSWQLAQSCFSHPDAPTQSLREQMRLSANAMLLDGFEFCLKVREAPARAPREVQWAAFQKKLSTAYLLRLPVQRRVARCWDMVCTWTPQQVFGCSAAQLVTLLRRLKRETLARLELNRVPPGAVRDEMLKAAADFEEYVDQCIDLVGDMRRTGGPARPGLPPETMAQVAHFAYITRLRRP